MLFNFLEKRRLKQKQKEEAVNRKMFFELVDKVGKEAYFANKPKAMIETNKIRAIKGHLTFLNEMSENGINFFIAEVTVSAYNLILGNISYDAVGYIFSTQELVKKGYLDI